MNKRKNSMRRKGESKQKMGKYMYILFNVTFIRLLFTNHHILTSFGLKRLTRTAVGSQRREIVSIYTELEFDLVI
jgi:hypothetical protein